jgi:hypothetical protein
MSKSRRGDRPQGGQQRSNPQNRGENRPNSNGGNNGNTAGGSKNSKRNRDRRREKNREGQKQKVTPLTPERRELLETITTRLKQDSLNRETAIREFHEAPRTCPRCSEPITDISSALVDSASGLPIHFDCVLEVLREREDCAPNETIAYIGNGKFAVVVLGTEAGKKFGIRKTIDWEKSDGPPEWRETLTGLYSQVV